MDFNAEALRKRRRTETKSRPESAEEAEVLRLDRRERTGKSGV
jgi:hypothetical protein